MKTLSLVLALLALNTSAHAGNSYFCKFVSGDDIGSNFSISISSNGETLYYKPDGANYKANIDYNYTPRGNKGFVRFFLDPKSGYNDEYTPEFIIEKSLLTGGRTLTTGEKGGTLKYQARGEGYFGGTYTCTAK